MRWYFHIDTCTRCPINLVYRMSMMPPHTAMGIHQNLDGTNWQGVEQQQRDIVTDTRNTRHIQLTNPGGLNGQHIDQRCPALRWINRGDARACNNRGCGAENWALRSFNRL